MNQMVRYGVIFGLVFQSLVLMWCAGRMPGARASMDLGQTCAAAPAMHESPSCCESNEDSAVTAVSAGGQPGMATLPERCCQCPLTVEEPRVPVAPDRRPAVELMRAPIAIASAIDLLLPARSTLFIASVPASIHPPDFAGRLACERFCRWTI